MLIFMCVWMQGLSWGAEIDDLVPFVIQVESSGNSNAISKAGCIGLMQISAIVLKEYNQEQLKKKEEDMYYVGVTFTYGNNHEWDLCTYENYHLFVPEINKQIGTWYLRRLKEHYLKDDYTIERMLVSYNGGITRMRRLLREGKDWQDMPRESVNYVKKVLKLYQRQK